MRIFAIIWMSLFIGLPSVLLVVGINMVRSQHHQIHHYQPVPAVILTSKVEVSRSSKGQATYRAAITYEYDIQGTKLTGSQVLPVDISTSSDGWFNDLVNRYPPGTKTTAWHDPAAVDQVFLVPYLAFDPYIFVLFPMYFIVIGLLVGVAMLRQGPKCIPPIPQQQGDYLLTPHRPIATRFRLALLVTLLWWPVGIVTMGHYFSVATEIEKGAWVMSAVYFGTGLIPLSVLTYFTLLGRTVDEPRVTVDTEYFALGDTFHVLVEQPVRMKVLVTAMEVSLVCTQYTKTSRGSKTTYSSNEIYEKKFDMLEGKQVEAQADQPLSGLQEFEIPRDRPASSYTGYPHHKWHLRVTTRIANRPDYRGVFALHVEPARA